MPGSSGGQFKVIHASAGSGKTFTLVKEYLLLALRDNNPRYYSRILAVTFTNAAAAEMKERVLKNLHEFSQPGFSSDLFQEIASTLRLTSDELYARSKAVARHMLHNYGQLSILTIDSFTAKLIRSFARDLMLRHDFNVETDSATFLQQVVDECIAEIGIDPEITAYLVSFSLQQYEDGKDWDLRKAIIATAQELLKETALSALSRLKDFSTEDFKKISKKIQDEIEKLEESISSIGEEAIALINTKGLNKSDFRNGNSGGISLFYRAAKLKMSDPAGPRAIEMATSDNWAAGKSSAATIQTVNEVRMTLQPMLQKLVELMSAENLIRFEILERIKSKLFAVGMLNTLVRYADKWREEKNTLLVADFHRLVNDVVTENNAPFIYERIGTRYRHIMIDEFQDTSTLQWNNAFPMIENALAEDNTNLIVGDAKQAIYRWRGGDSKQFVDLPLINGEKSAVLSHQFNASHLEDNWRSSRAVVSFNNALFEALKLKNESLSKIYKNHSQHIKKDKEGYVNVSIVSEKNKKEMRPKTLQSILEFIEECLHDGYRPGEIVVLTRKGKQQSSEIAELLIANGHKVTTRESLLAGNSGSVIAVISFIEILLNPVTGYPHVALVEALSEFNPGIRVTELYDNNRIHLENKARYNSLALIKRYYGDHSHIHVSLSPTELVFAITQYLSLPFDNALELLLEKIRAQCVNNNVTLSSFITWWHDNEEKHFTTSIASNDSIQLMTIHRAKGLEFPVVIFPMTGGRPPDDEIWINPEEFVSDLPSALVRSGYSAKVSDLMPKEFREESNNKYLDELNTFYVATTRAKDRLYLLIEHNSTSNELTKDVVRVLSDQYPSIVESAIAQVGTRLKNTSGMIDDEVEKLSFQTRDTTFSKPSIRFSSIYTNDQMNYGEWLHACLSFISSKENITDAIRKTTSRFGISDIVLIEKLKNDSLRIVTDPRYTSWFSHSNKILAEREIVTPEGELLRPDRVVVFEDRVEVIDFKTGIRKERHKTQVLNYTNQIKTLFQIPVKGFILYTSNMECVEVNM